MDDILVALRMVVALAAVLGLLVFLSRRMQKAGAKGAHPLSGLVPGRPRALRGLSRPGALRTRGTAKARTEKITVIARSGLAGKAQLVVAEFGGIRYVLGVTEQGVSVVDTQEAPAPFDEEDPHEVEAAPPADPDGRTLKSVA
ncbi:flagellar biosynthetic protein FliO [uncultured Microbacterium sp.]|uniref:flagellar biosynthetic protein FliO n=1 Tax=uncultured Microbacterium sp. TaxID=191216 RepID=UPI0028DBACF2|nr:flagellar biosynthetic protein FliO [uncultured Microbacterium sp.]